MDRKRLLFCAAALLPVVAVCLLLIGYPRGPDPDIFPRRYREGVREVQVEGRWYSLVDETSSPLVRFVPPELSPGREIAHINQDGTVTVTSHVEASKRSGRGGVGYPYPR